MRAALVVTALLAWPAGSHADSDKSNVKQGDRVRAMRSGTNSWFAGTATRANPDIDLGDTNEVTFDDGGTAVFGPITWPAGAKPFDWKAGTNLQCSDDPKVTASIGDEDSDKLTAGTVTAIDGKTVELDVKGAKKKFPLAACRQHRTWWDEVTEERRNYAKYPKVKAPPKQGAKSPSADAITSSFSFSLSSEDGGSYIVIKSCVATGSGWTKMNSGDELTARTIDVACVTAVPLPPKPKENFACLVEYGICRQPYQGGGQFGGCEWHYTGKQPNQIDCKAVK